MIKWIFITKHLRSNIQNFHNCGSSGHTRRYTIGIAPPIGRSRAALWWLLLLYVMFLIFSRAEEEVMEDSTNCTAAFSTICSF